MQKYIARTFFVDGFFFSFSPRQPRRQRGQVVKCGSQILTAVEAPGSILQTECRLQRKQIFDPDAPVAIQTFTFTDSLQVIASKKGASAGLVSTPRQDADAAELNKWQLSA